MPRIIDILRDKPDDDGQEDKKKGDAEKGKTEELSLEKSHVSYPKEILTPPSIPVGEPASTSLISQKLISAVKKEGVDNPERAKEVYENLLQTIKTLLEKLRDKEDVSPYREKANNVIDETTNQLILGDRILDTVYKRPENVYYLPYHITNIAVLSLALGISMGLNKSRLNHLGLAALFCDVGLDAFRDIIGRDAQLTDKERNTVKTHIGGSLEIIKGIDKISNIDTVIETVKKHHERVNGLGYPSRLKSENINLEAKIIGLVDTYEALTHERSYRKAVSPHQAVRLILSSLKAYFDSSVMKAFVDKMSVYPVGSIVRLNTQELAKVIYAPSGSPLRPVVTIIQGPSGEVVKESKTIDLSKQDFPYIQESV